jgi:hypothetical protein
MLLLETISKGLEAVVARRLSYLAETYRLLPENHFGGRPQRSSDSSKKAILPGRDLQTATGEPLWRAAKQVNRAGAQSAGGEDTRSVAGLQSPVPGVV